MCIRDRVSTQSTGASQANERKAKSRHAMRSDSSLRMRSIFKRRDKKPKSTSMRDDTSDRFDEDLPPTELHRLFASDTPATKEEVLSALQGITTDMINKRDTDSWTPLHNLCERMFLPGDLQLVELLLSNGANAGISTLQDGNTALHYFVRHSPSPNLKTEIDEIVKLLLANGADIDSKNHQLETPLHLAVMRGNLIMTDILIANGASYHQRNSVGASPLHLAVIRGNVDIIKLMLKLNLDPFDDRMIVNGKPTSCFDLLDPKKDSKVYTMLRSLPHKSNQTIICQLCGKSGHTAKHCIPTCIICRKNGHTSNECSSNLASSPDSGGNLNSIQLLSRK
eukprot:TRINITY_DN6667_c0_g1_i3.p1 TRINITY_DN6667_c0_g1~~TRINITY_DN6667_c0_g1_i3.p1  ORF type:complete len:338 (-),score=30.56 TRINITY_DN6667_c0_g1_i3:1151-2164(-)